VHVQSSSDWTDLTPPSCSKTEGGSEVLSTGTSETDGDGNPVTLESQAGSAGDVFLLTLCYEFEMAQILPFLQLTTNGLSNGSAVIQSATTFRIEPYKD
jgi:hypothetical protein